MSLHLELEEKRYFTVKELKAARDRMVQFSLETLQNIGSRREEYKSYILTTAMWPYEFSLEQIAEFEKYTDLKEFERILHEKQAMDVYYAKPAIYENSDGGRIGAFYTLTEECESIFPDKADGFLNLDNIKIDDGFVRFYIFSEDRALDGIYDYEQFVKYQLEHGATYYDDSHILVPEMTKAQMEEMAEQIS